MRRGAMRCSQPRNNTFAGYTDWRLPNKAGTLVDDSCFAAINDTVFLKHGCRLDVDEHYSCSGLAAHGSSFFGHGDSNASNKTGDDVAGTARARRDSPLTLWRR